MKGTKDCPYCGESIMAGGLVCPYCDRNLITNKASLPKPTMKVCPFCAEEIKVAAIVCRYCGRDLPKPSDKPKAGHERTSWQEGMRFAGVFTALSLIGLLSRFSDLSPEEIASRLLISLPIFFLLLTLIGAFHVWLWRKNRYWLVLVYVLIIGFGLHYNFEIRKRIGSIYIDCGGCTGAPYFDDISAVRIHLGYLPNGERCQVKDWYSGSEQQRALELKNHKNYMSGNFYFVECPSGSGWVNETNTWR